MSLLLIAIGFTVFTAMALVVFILFSDQSTVEARLSDVNTPTVQSESLNFRDFLSYLTQPLVPLRRMLRQRGESDLAYRLALAGYKEPEDVDTFLNAKLLGPVVGVLLATFTGPSNMLLFSLLFAALGFFGPDLFLIRARTKRTTSIALSLPDAMDLLVMCMEAGLGIDQAMLRVAQEMGKANPALSDELKIVAREQRAGRPRIEAWRNMADRVDLDVLRQFAGMLTQSERLGTPIAKSLSQFADNLRHKRQMDAEEKAAKTSIKLLFPLIFFIFPAIFVVILGPAVFSMVEVFDK